MDVIALRNIRVNGKHGVNPGERDREQPFVVDLEMEADLAAAARSDDLSDTVNYAAVHAAVVRTVQSRSFALLEGLAEAILEAIFTNDRIVAAHVRVAKPELLDGATPSVGLRRENPNVRR